LLQPETLPHTIRLTIDGGSYEWKLGEATQYSQEAYQRHRSWNVSVPEDPGPRQGLYRSLCQLFRRLPEEARLRALDELCTCVDAPPAGRPTHRALSREGVV
jgi:hypothetical protein